MLVDSVLHANTMANSLLPVTSQVNMMLLPMVTFTNSGKTAANVGGSVCVCGVVGGNWYS